MSQSITDNYVGSIWKGDDESDKGNMVAFCFSNTDASPSLPRARLAQSFCVQEERMSRRCVQVGGRISRFLVDPVHKNLV